MSTMCSPAINNDYQSLHKINSNKQTLNNNELKINNQLVDYSLSELKEIIDYQQTQIEHNQQLVISRKQYLKYYEQQLKISFNKLNYLIKYFDPLRKFQLILNNEQMQNQNELDKLKQELMIRNKLNEQQHHKITYQREIFALKQNELKQLNQRIEELQQKLKKKNISQTVTPTIQSYTLSNDFQTSLNIVQDTLNNIDVDEIEKRMIQLANSFNSIHTNQSLIINQINNSNNQNKTNNDSLSISPLEIPFASNDRIATPYITDTSTSSPSKTEEQLLPPNLRLNDDIISVHFNNITSNIKKRHSLSDPNDLLIKHLSLNIEQQPIHIQDNSSLSDTKSSIMTYENLSDFYTNINNNKLDEDTEEEDEQQQTIIESLISNTDSEDSISEDIESSMSFSTAMTMPINNLKSLLKTSTTSKNTSRRVIFDPLVLLLDAAIIGELELVIKSAKEVKNPSQPNDEGLTALHNAVCASNFECIKFLVEFACDINYADNDGWTPLHCAASCNKTRIVEYLIQHGACIYATTIRDNETALEKCEEDDENYISCSQYLLNVQNDLGVINNGLVYALYDYDPNLVVDDELEFKNGDQLKILKLGDENECEWWWAKHEDTKKEGYVPRNYLGLYPRIRSDTMTLTNS